MLIDIDEDACDDDHDVDPEFEFVFDRIRHDQLQGVKVANYLCIGFLAPTQREYQIGSMLFQLQYLLCPLLCIFPLLIFRKFGDS